MASIELPFSLPGFVVDEVRDRDDVIEVVARPTQKQAICPSCRQPSRRIHSYYQRAPADLPILDRRVHLQLTVRRFRCETPECAKTTFAERLPTLLAPHAQQTQRLNTALSAVAFALGGEAGSRLATKLALPISGDTLLRMIRKTPEPTPEMPSILGVDDWAQLRGRVYGTILVDLQRCRVVDLLEDRTAETLAQWLKAHLSVRTVARDRSREYIRGITLGAPQAQQVADRWHLLVNLRETLERLLDRLRPTLGLPLPSKPDAIPILRLRHRGRQEMAARDGRRARRLALHEKIHRLRQAGHAIRAIARHLQISRMTVYKYLSSACLPERVARRRVSSRLDPYLDYLVQRWKAGCRNASQLWREIRAQGYSGVPKQVALWVYERREQLSRMTPKKYRVRANLGKVHLSLLPEVADQPPLPSARCLVWLFLKHTNQLESEELLMREQLLMHPTLSQAKQLAQDFQRIVRKRESAMLDRWLKTCEATEIPEFANFALGLRQDYRAVRAAVSSPWSNGQTEGQVNRLKLLKRQMYGRAKFDLLRLRFLHPP
jgi:transposase